MTAMDDKDRGDGFRVFLDPKNLEEYPEIKAWFFKLKPKAGQDRERLITQIRTSGERICGVHSIQVHPRLLEKQTKGKIEVCPSCGEGYPLRDGNVCLACQGRSPYIVPEYLEKDV